MNTTTINQKTLLDAIGIQDLGPEEQQELILDLNSLLFKGSLIRLIERMDDATRDAFNALMDTDPSEDQVEAFLAKNVPDADNAVQETLDELTSDILAVTGPVTQ